MSIKIMDTNFLSAEIDIAFPPVEMPHGVDLLFHSTGDFESKSLLEDLEQYRSREIDADAIRLVHQEMSNLSAKAWRWILPHYLKFCLTPEAEYSRMEAEFLIYSLGPNAEFQRDTLQRLSLLNADQINCLIHFLEWCAGHPFWKEYFPEDISKAINFLRASFPVCGS